MDPEELDPATLLLLLAGHLRERVITHPFSTVGAAAAVGYVLGFGLPGALLRAAGALAFRAASVQLIEEVLGTVSHANDMTNVGSPSANTRGAGGSHAGTATSGEPYVS